MAIPLDMKTYFTTDDDNTTYSATGLPNGLTIATGPGSAGGVIEGNPVAAGAYSVVVTALTTGGSATQSFTWNVNEPGAVLAPSASAVMASASLAAPANYTLNGSDVSAIVNDVSGGNAITQTLTANQPELVTYDGNNMLQITDANNEFMLWLPDDDQATYHFTFGVADWQTTTAESRLLSGNGISNSPAIAQDGSSSGLAQGQTVGSGNIEIYVDGVELSVYDRNGLHDALVPSGTETKVVTILNVDLSRNSEYETGVRLLGEGLRNGTFKSPGFIAFATSSERTTNEDRINSLVGQ